MGRNAVETVLGAVVLVVAGMFVFFAYGTAQVKGVSGYEVRANFFKVGTVSSSTLDTKTFEAVVLMSISPEVKLPVDTIAGIGSEGIVGGKYVRLEPGSAGEFVEAGGALKKTKDYRSLEDQVGEIIFLATGGPNKQ